MKKLALLIMILTFTQICNCQVIPDSALFLGQAKPMYNPKKFNLSLSSGFFAAERVAISNDNMRIYYSELNGYGASAKSRIKYYSYSEGKWNGPAVLFENFFSPALSVDGNKMFMQKFGVTYQEVWFSIKTNNVWSNPAKYMPGKNVDYLLCETNNGNMYFGSRSAKDGLGKLDWSKFIINGKDTVVQSLGTPLCTSADDVDFIVSGNDSIMIIAAGTSVNRKSYGKLDLFISYKKNDCTWTNIKNLGTKINVNDPNNGRWAPCLTSDNKYLFYTGGWSSPSVYWVQIDNLIESNRLSNFMPYINKSIMNQIDTIGKFYTFIVPDSSFIDDDGNSTLTYSAKQSNGMALPSWLSFNNMTKSFTGTLSALGSYSLNVTATDTANSSISSTFILKVVENHTSIKKINNNDIQIFSNPINDNLYISFGGITSGNTIVELVTLEGKIVYSDSFHDLSTTTINLKNYIKGIYIINLNIDGKKSSRKICIE